MKYDLVGYLLDAVDRDEQDEIERRLESDRELRAELERLRSLIVPLASDDSIEPPPGLARRTAAYVEGIAAGDRRGTAAREPAIRPVDLVAAVGVLLMVSALTLPAVVALRGDHDRILCADRLRNLGVALAAYSHSESGFLPYVQAGGPLNNAGIFAVLLKSRDLLADSADLVCPSANNAVAVVPSLDQFLREQKNSIQSDRFRRLMAGSYGYFLGYESGGSLVGLRNGSSRQVVAADRPPRENEKSVDGVGNSPNHGGRGQNVLFGDGRVGWLPTPSQAGDDVYTNAECKVGAGLGPYDAVLGVSEAVPFPAESLGL